MPTNGTGLGRLIIEYWPWAAGIFGLGVANNKLMRKSQFYIEQEKCQAKFCAKVDAVAKTVTDSNLKVAEHMGAVQQYMKEHMK